MFRYVGNSGVDVLGRKKRRKSAAEARAETTKREPIKEGTANERQGRLAGAPPSVSSHFASSTRIVSIVAVALLYWPQNQAMASAAVMLKLMLHLGRSRLSVARDSPRGGFAASSRLRFSQPIPRQSEVRAMHFGPQIARFLTNEERREKGMPAVDPKRTFTSLKQASRWMPFFFDPCQQKAHQPEDGDAFDTLNIVY